MDKRTKKMVVIMGSPHLNGNVASATDAVISGAKQFGMEVEKYELAKLNIKNCCGCRSCIKNVGQCILKDDMMVIFESIKRADILLIASPIYICQVNGYTKTFLDRLYPLTDAQHKPRFGTRKLIMLYTYGAPIPFLFRHYMKQTGKDLKAMGLRLYKTVILKGCTTLEITRNDEKRQKQLRLLGEKIANL